MTFPYFPLEAGPFSTQRSSSKNTESFIPASHSNTWVSSDGWFKRQESKEKGFGVKALRNSVFDAGFQCPKVVNGTKNGINA